jgi:hypothetical protein
MHDTISSSDRCVDRESVPDKAAVEETPYGSLLWIETSLGVRDLLGFADVTDWNGMADELRRRGIDHGAIYDRIRFPELTLKS